MVESHCGCYIVHPGLGLSYVQVLGMGEMYNVLNKTSVEPHDKISEVSKHAMHIPKSPGREGVARGTMEQRRGNFLVLGV